MTALTTPKPHIFTGTLEQLFHALATATGTYSPELQAQTKAGYIERIHELQDQQVIDALNERNAEEPEFVDDWCWSDWSEPSDAYKAACPVEPENYAY